VEEKLDEKTVETERLLSENKHLADENKRLADNVHTWENLARGGVFKRLIWAVAGKTP